MALRTFADDSSALADCLHEVQEAIRIINQERHRMRNERPTPWSTAKNKAVVLGDSKWTVQRGYMNKKEVMIFSHPNCTLTTFIRELTSQQGDGYDIIFGL